jgi:hypothetical protein
MAAAQEALQQQSFRHEPGAARRPFFIFTSVIILHLKESFRCQKIDVFWAYFIPSLDDGRTILFTSADKAATPVAATRTTSFH